jgi:hypothetical protein
VERGEAAEAEGDHEVDDEESQSAGDGGGKAGGEFVVGADDVITGVHEPVEEWGFVGAKGAVESGDEEIAVLDHVAGGGGEAGFVAVEEGDVAEAGGIEKEAEEEEEEQVHLAPPAFILNGGFEHSYCSVATARISESIRDKRTRYYTLSARESKGILVRG